MTKLGKILTATTVTALLFFLVTFEYTCQKNWYILNNQKVKVVTYDQDGFKLYEDGTMEVEPLTEVEKRELCESLP